MTDHVCAWAAASPSEVSGVELLQGCVELVICEHNSTRYSVVSVRLKEIEHLREKRTRLLIRTRVAGTHEHETIPAGRNDGRRHVFDAQFGGHP